MSLLMWDLLDMGFYVWIRFCGFVVPPANCLNLTFYVLIYGYGCVVFVLLICFLVLIMVAFHVFTGVYFFECCFDCW